MPESILYINAQVHTGQLRDAGSELLYQDLMVVNLYAESVDEVSPAVNPLPQDLLVGLALTPNVLPDRLRNSWKKSERDLARLLCNAHILNYPHKVWKGLIQRLQYAPSLPTKEEAHGFLDRTKSRLINLQSSAVYGRLDSLRWTSFVYVENLMLRGAVFGRVFFAEPARPNLN